ncbi:MAG: hypothetical protein GX561_07580 [Lentisphaerae bacterium]|jgi:hypothetical protein|nr:hypothetical protein [Lentisphaerota bacterium]
MVFVSNILGTILVDPVLPIWLLVVCGIVFAILSWRTYAACSLSLPERLILWMLRMMAFAIIAYLMLQASRRVEKQVEEKPVLAVALDVSASMDDKIPGVVSQRSVNALGVLKASWLKDLGDTHRVMYFGIGQDLEEGLSDEKGLHFTAPRTHLVPSLSKLESRLRGENVAGVLLLTDGLDQSGQSIDVLSCQAPYLIPELEPPIERESVKTVDYAITQLGYPKRVTKGWKVSVVVHLERRAGSGNAQFKVNLSQGKQVIQQLDAIFEGEDKYCKLTFEVEPTEVGAILYRVDMAPPNDVDPDNNFKDFLVEVTDDQNRVLYLEGPPRYDFTYLKRALASERNIRLSAFIRGADGTFISFEERQAPDGGMKSTLDAENLRNFKVLVLGDLPGNVFKPEEVAAVKGFVDKGGGLIFFGAANAYGKNGYLSKEIFGDLSPIASQEDSQMREGARYRVDFTPYGRTLPAFEGLLDDAHFPALLSIWGPVKPGEFSESVIETSDGQPVLAARRYGQGRVAILLSNTLWKWQLGGTDGLGKGLYGRFITQLIHWLNPGGHDAEDSETLQIVIASGEVDLRQSVAIGGYGGKVKSGCDCLITTPSGETLTIPMRQAKLEAQVGLRRAQDGVLCDWIPEAVGTYQIVLKSKDGTQQAQTLLLVKKPEHELTGATLNHVLLNELAGRSKGVFLPLEQHAKLREKLTAEPRVIETVHEYPIWNRWLWLAPLIAIFCLEWYLRRKWDMV